MAITINADMDGRLVHSTPILQEKTVTPSQMEQIILPDPGYNGLSRAIVEAIPGQYIVPAGTIIITSPGTYDVKNYENAKIVSSRVIASEQTGQMYSGSIQGEISGWAAGPTVFNITNDDLYQLYNEAEPLLLTVGGITYELHSVSNDYPKWTGDGDFWIEADSLDYFYVVSAANNGTITYKIEVIR